ncbi:glycine betaine ABC transporter substrate-binding protein [Undibacterium sp. TJN19]|uniref:glycine betaine ABC transporter substrate-binding protein n=1 Tax=Undibacterium sp. TJN19 TaxID=3413055 RepID=UPI003BEFF0B4
MCMHFAVAHAEATLNIGSKRFTESYVLGEILSQTAAPFSPVHHHQGLGNTAIVFNALKSGNIDVYPEYMGTINTEILKHDSATPLAQLQSELALQGLGIAVPLGFNNTYALAMRPEVAGSKAAGNAPQTLTGLSAHTALRFGLSHEFLGRADGWPGLAQRYHLPQQATGLDHGIAYEALNARQVDVIDIYSTDAKIKQLGLRVLVDDGNYFPRYDAVLLYRLDVPSRFPKAWAAIRQLEGKIDNTRMIAMNAAVELDGQSFAAVAQQFVAKSSASPPARTGFLQKLLGDDFSRLSRQHLLLVAAAVLLACAVGIPLGIIAASRPRLRNAVMAVVGILQTVPSLALLAMLIPLLGKIGFMPALIALSLYALLPIVRNTCVGLAQVPTGLRLAAQALGLSARDRLLHIDLPLALPMLLAGIQTAAVMSVGTATIAAFIGAGGYGERIAIGLALNDNQMLLAGALPAAALALLTQWGFDLLERWLIRGPRTGHDKH